MSPETNFHEENSSKKKMQMTKYPMQHLLTLTKKLLNQFLKCGNIKKAHKQIDKEKNRKTVKQPLASLKKL